MVNNPEDTGLPWPSPPLQAHRLKLHQRIAGWFLVLLCSPIAIGVVVLVLGYTDEGRDLVLDTATSLGLGTRIQGAGIVPERCTYRSSSGKYSMSGYECDIVVLQRQPDGKISRTKRGLSVGSEDDAGQAREARHLFGTIGLRFPFGVMASRWLRMLPLCFAFGIPAFIVVFVWGMLRDDRALRRAAREGRIVPADLLYFQAGRCHFAWIDAKGRQRFGKAPGGDALRRDGIITLGVVLLSHGKRAWLIHSNFYPLLLPPEDAARVEAASLAMRTAWRPRLAPLPDEATTPAGRLDAIRTLLLGKDKKDAARAYELAWRLVWDFEDQQTATDACELRHQAGARLGPKRSFDVLQSCRDKYQPTGSV
jgi:hypothetical protein